MRRRMCQAETSALALAERVSARTGLVPAQDKSRRAGRVPRHACAACAGARRAYGALGTSTLGAAYASGWLAPGNPWLAQTVRPCAPSIRARMKYKSRQMSDGCGGLSAHGSYIVFAESACRRVVLRSSMPAPRHLRRPPLNRSVVVAMIVSHMLMGLGLIQHLVLGLDSGDNRCRQHGCHQGM